MEFDVGEFAFQGREERFVPAEVEFRMQTALEQQLVAAEGDGFANLLTVFVKGGDVGAVPVGEAAVEVAEFAATDADVGNVDVAVDLPGDGVAGVELAATGVGCGHQFGQRNVVPQREGFVEGERVAGDGFGE